jgi:hypothetical protein
MKSHKKEGSSIERDKAHLLLWFKQHGFSALETKQLCERIKNLNARRDRLQADLSSNFFLIQIDYHSQLIQLLEGKMEADSLKGWDGTSRVGAHELTITKAKRLVQIERALKKTKVGKARK